MSCFCLLRLGCEDDGPLEKRPRPQLSARPKGRQGRKAGPADHAVHVLRRLVQGARTPESASKSLQQITGSRSLAPARPGPGWGAGGGTAASWVLWPRCKPPGPHLLKTTDQLHTHPPQGDTQGAVTTSGTRGTGFWPIRDGEQAAGQSETGSEPGDSARLC